MLINGLIRLVARRRFKNSCSIEAVRKVVAKLDRPVKLSPGMEHRLETIVDLKCE